MKCDDCLNILEAYVDGEVGEREAESVRTHLIKCSACESEFEALSTESELYARYDRELQVSPALWNGIAARIATETPVVKPTRSESRGWFAGLFAIPRLGFAFSGAAAVLIAMVAVGYFYFRTNETDQRLRLAGSNNVRPSTTNIDFAPSPTPVNGVTPTGVPSETGPVIAKSNEKRGPKPTSGESDVLFTNAAYTQEDRDTASHLERAQNLLTSFRTLQITDDDQEVDVSYEKAESRKLLNENVVLRRDAEMAGKFPAKAMLGSLEPFLIDIANLPEKATAREVQQIKDRVQRTEIVAELRSY
ncbi:MAG: anti-sigma factor family protein [Pyrinomonadaceae bacterium]